MKYNIGEVARVMGLTPGALHFFERQGIIHPEKEENGRRFFTVHDVFRLLSYKKYRAMDVPMKDIGRQFSQAGDPLPVIARRLAKRREEAERKERYYRALQGDIRWFEEAVRRIDRHIDRVDVCSSPAVYLLRYPEHGLIPPSREHQRQVQRWINMMPATRLSILAAPEGPEACLCYGLSPEDRKRPGAPEEMENVLWLPERPALHTIVQVRDAVYESPRLAFEGLLAFGRAHGFSLRESCFGHILVVDCSGGHRQTYVEVWAPFEPFQGEAAREA